DCGAEVRATLPDGRDPVGYGPQLQTEIVVGKIEERLPYRKIEGRLDREGIPSCPATLQAVVWGAGEKLGGSAEEILQRIRQAPVIHADETSFHVGGETWWLWTFCTKEDAYFVLRPSRGEDVVQEVLGEGFPGKVVVCDGWKAYPHDGWVLQRCWAHLLRVAKAGAEESSKAKKLYTKLCRLYERLTMDLETASPRTRARRLALGERKLARMVERFGKSGAEGVRKVVTYLTNGMPWWLTFLRRTGVEPTNNRGERAIREAVVMRKILGTLRNEKGAEAFARLLSVFGTWRLRGEDPAKNLYAVLS
ncbi:MAG: IS66 family transposase, partial [Nitrososphaerales archaeon]